MKQLSKRFLLSRMWVGRDECCPYTGVFIQSNKVLHALLFLLLCCLLAACGPIDGVTPASQRPSIPTAKAPPTQRPATILRKATNDSCPADLRNATTCFTPYTLRVA